MCVYTQTVQQHCLDFIYKATKVMVITLNGEGFGRKQSWHSWMCSDIRRKGARKITVPRDIRGQIRDLNWVFSE